MGAGNSWQAKRQALVIQNSERWARHRLHSRGRESHVPAVLLEDRAEDGCGDAELGAQRGGRHPRQH